MADSDSAKKKAVPERDTRGRWKRGKSGSSATQWGPDNLPPKSKGRPTQEAWVAELKARLESRPELRQALADVLLKTALKGSETARLKALSMIADRVEGPVTRKIEADVAVNSGVLVVPGQASPQEWLERAAQKNAVAKEPGGEHGG